jgi:hypothetical protein
MFPDLAVACKVPPIVEAARFKPAVDTNVALPEDPVVFKLTAPVNALLA